VKNFLKNLKLNETNVSMLLGIIVVVIVGGLLVNYFRSVNTSPDISSTETDLPSDQIVGTTPKLENLPSDYVVQKGDTLWSVSEAVYGSGYNWVDVYSANKTTLGNNPNSLNEGAKITLPKVEVKQATMVKTPTEPVSYTVVKGDNLWNVLVKTCNNGYLWPAVAKANNIPNANQIEIGQKLTISCN
jgi:nucleoid-associated protein YgaU